MYLIVSDQSLTYSQTVWQVIAGAAIGGVTYAG
jgi:hypothetical protein